MLPICSVGITPGILYSTGRAGLNRKVELIRPGWLASSCGNGPRSKKNPQQLSISLLPKRLEDKAVVYSQGVQA